MGLLTGKTALITGATRGIGLAMALKFANEGANVAFTYASSEEKAKAMDELPKDKMPVGKGERSDDFTLHSLDIKPGDTLYLYTDGFADQFGGIKGKKFKYKQLNELLLSLKDVPLTEQKQMIEQTFKTWKGNLEQVDDVLIAGIRI